MDDIDKLIDERAAAERVLIAAKAGLDAATLAVKNAAADASAAQDALNKALTAEILRRTHEDPAE